MRSGLMTRPPASWAMRIMRPSTYAGTPVIMRSGGVPRRLGQLARTRSWLPPMPPEVTMTAPASIENALSISRELSWPRATGSSFSTEPRAPVTRPLEAMSSST